MTAKTPRPLDPTNDDPTVTIVGGAELNALLRALMEAKFHDDPSDELVAWSPLVADIANRVADALERVPRRVPEREPGAWRRTANHAAKVVAVRARIRNCAPWAGWNEEQRRAQVAVLFAPLRPDATLVDQLVTEDGSSP